MLGRGDGVGMTTVPKEGQGHLEPTMAGTTPDQASGKNSLSL
jgi:hypothetical protein